MGHGVILLSLDAAGGEAGNDTPLEDQNEYDQRYGDDNRGGHDAAPGDFELAVAERAARWRPARALRVRRGKSEREEDSFQAVMKASSPVVTSAGHISGMNTWVMMTQDEAPSTIAASSISIGRSRMKVVSTQTVNGSVKIM